MKHWSNKFYIAVVAILLATTGGAGAQGCFGVGPSFEKMANDAKFVGQVKCVHAGGIFARVVVEDSWKGLAKGAEFILYVRPNQLEDHFPVMLCGERAIVTAEPVTALPLGGIWDAYHLSHAANPLWSRVIRADLQDSRWGWFSGQQKSQKTFEAAHAKTRSNLQEFFALADAEREKRNLIDAAIRCQNRDISGGEHLAAFTASLRRAPNLEGVVNELLKSVSQPNGFQASSVFLMLDLGGGRETNKVLERQRNGFSRIPAEYLNMIERRQAQMHRDPIKRWDFVEEVSPDKIEAARAALAHRVWTKESARHLAILARYQPALAVDALLGWTEEPPDDPRIEAVEGYFFGSQFALLCGTDRRRHLTRLLHASDRYVRVAAAIYLRYEDPGLATQHLREFCALPGDAGVWAALGWAKSGDITFVRRALEVFKTRPLNCQWGSLHRTLQGRVKVLLSNSAQHSAVEQPDFDLINQSDSPALFYEACLQWWEHNKSKITLYDPWLKTLDEQGID